jgi:hypothetical protein
LNGDRRSFKNITNKPDGIFCKMQERIPLSPPQRKSTAEAVLFFVVWRIQWGSNAVKKQHSALFLNGDRRIFQNITYKLILDVLKNSRTNPSPPAEITKRNPK